MLTMHNLKPAVGATHKSKKIGRGNASGHGTYSGHGGKGQTARSGGSRGLHLKSFKALMQSTPKLGGFRSLRVKPTILNLTVLDKKFAAGDVVNLALLKKMKIIGKNVATVKIIAGGELTKKLILEKIATTKSVAEKIKNLGGEIK